jgi:hypothetical protein
VNVRGTRKAWLLLRAALSAISFTVLFAIVGTSGPIGAADPTGVNNAMVSSGTAHPAWARALGAGVTVLSPAPATSGNESPGAAYQGDLYALAVGNILSGCRYIQPSVQGVCRESNSGPTTSVPYTETIKNLAIGYVAINGNQALVGYTGMFCISDERPRCMTNTNPAAILSSGKSFKALWAESVADESINANFYSLGPCVEAAGKWYFYLHIVMHS